MTVGTRRRLIAHGLMFLVAWPLLTICATAFESRMVPYISPPWGLAFAASTAGVVLLAPDFLLAGALLSGLSLLVFNRFGRDAFRSTFRHLCLEPVAVVLWITLIASLAYPTIFSHAVFVPFGELPFFVVWSLFLFIVAILLFDLAPRRGRRKLAAVLAAMGLVVSAAPFVANSLRGSAGRPSAVVLLGIDSLSQSDDVERLRKWFGSRGGTWYERAVAPGLLTNAVWASVMTMQPVSEHRVLHPFQPFPAGRARLIENAKRAGFHTVSVFSDQLTSAIGSQAGFDEDRSGPIGWRQLALATVENSSFLLPLLRPLLPEMPWSVAPPNHAGTFTYDLNREVSEILTSGKEGRRTFVAAHLTYLHMAAFPRSIDLSWSELARIVRTPAGRLRDRTLDWQYTDDSSDPLLLHRWKVAKFQRVVSEMIESSGFLGKGGRLLVFSDHGQRVGLTPRTFISPRYHHVVLASIGLPPRPAGEVRSLTDIGALLGLSSDSQDSVPVVEFASPPEALWGKLASTARMEWSGVIALNPALLDAVSAGLQTYRPWTVPAASEGAAEDGETSRSHPESR